MYSLAVVRRQLHARHQLHAELAPCRGGLRQPGDRVVVRHRHGAQVAARREGHHLGWGEEAVGQRGVDVEIRDGPATHAAGRYLASSTVFLTALPFSTAMSSTV